MWVRCEICSTRTAKVCIQIDCASCGLSSAVTCRTCFEPLWVRCFNSHKEGHVLLSMQRTLLEQ